jgi:hypothetical protein
MFVETFIPFILEIVG